MLRDQKTKRGENTQAISWVFELSPKWGGDFTKNDEEINDFFLPMKKIDTINGT